MLPPGLAVEVARRREDAPLGQPVHGGAAVLAPGRPQVERPLGVVDPEPGRLERGLQDRAPVEVAAALLLDVVVVAQQGHHGVLHRAGDHQAGVLGHLEQLAQQARAPGEEARPVAGHVAALAERVGGDQALRRPAAHVRVQHADGLGVPAELAVALVGGQGGADRAGGVHPAPELRRVERRAVRVGRGVDPDERGAGGRRLVGVVGGQHLGARDARADLVGRVGGRGDHDRVAGAHAELEREVGDELLGADDRQDVLVPQRHRGPAALHVAPDRLPQGGRPPHRGVAGPAGRSVGQGADRGLGHRVDGRADRQVADAVGVRPGGGPGGRDGVPGEVGQAARQPGAHSPWGGSASTIGWSASILPILAAPPGLPIVSKNFTLAS